MTVTSVVRYPVIKPLENETVESFAARLIGIADTHKEPVFGDFNGIEVTVNPGDKANDVEFYIMRGFVRWEGNAPELHL